MLGYMEIPPKGCVRKWAVYYHSEWDAGGDPIEIHEDFTVLAKKYEERDDVIFGRIWVKKEENQK